MKTTLLIMAAEHMGVRSYEILINHSLETRACVHIQTKELREGFLHNSSH